MSGISGRLGDFGRTAALSALTGRVSASLNDTQSKVADGKSAHRLSDLGAEAGRYLSTSNEVARIASYAKNAEALARRLEGQSQALGALGDVAARTRALLVRAQGMDNPNVDDYGLGGQAKGLLDEAISVLNTRIEGSYIFAGLTSGTEPVGFGKIAKLDLGALATAGGELHLTFGTTNPVAVDVTVAPGANAAQAVRSAILAAAASRDLGIGSVEIATGSEIVVRSVRPGAELDVRIVVPNDRGATVSLYAERDAPPGSSTESYGYYRGLSAAGRGGVVLGDGLTVSPGVTADAPAIEKLIRSLRLVESAPTSPIVGEGTKATLAQALDLVTTSIEQIGQLVGEIGTKQVLVDDIAATHELTGLQLRETVDGLMNVDIGEAMTQLSSQQLQLQAAYMMLARLGSMSLLNFLR